MKQALVVDDDQMVRRLVCEILRGEGYETHEAGTLAEAERLVTRQTEATVLVVDGQLASWNGMDTGRIIEEARAFNDTLKIIGLTGNLMNVEEMALVGCDVVLSKPLTRLEALIEQLP